MIRNLTYRIEQMLIKNKLRAYCRNTVANSCQIAKSVDICDSILEEDSMFALHSSVRFSKIGKMTSIGRYSKITYSEIGSYCAISWDTTINAISHPHNHLTVSAFPYVPYVGRFVKERNQKHQTVVIGHDVWVGANAVVMPGVRIGNGAVIAATAVVTKDVPDYAIVAGVPAKIIKYRFNEKVIRELLKIRWWNLPRQIIKENINLFQNEFDSLSLEKLNELYEKFEKA